MNTGSEPRLRLGISACLLGQTVRFDAGHKRDPFLVDALGPFVDWVPVCPEVEVGMGTPRATLRLVRDGADVRMVQPATGRDWTAPMTAWARDRVAALDREQLAGFVLKKDSPSCGMERVKVYPADGGAGSRNGRGLFADALLARFPTLPVEEEGRLSDPRLRENFVERIFAFARLRDFFGARWTVGGLVRFHTAHKMTLLAHDRVAYDELGRLVAAARGQDRRELAARYRQRFMQALSKIATPRTHANVLMHIMGHFRESVDEASRRELLACIEDYRAGLLPLIVPLTLVRHHVRRLGLEYLAGQVYLDPHPRELMLRNRV